MNPALPVLVAASLVGLLSPGRGLRRAWVLVGLTGVLLLGAALRLPDGVPSPAARLAEHAPWMGIGDPAAGNPALVDVTYQIQPWLIYLRRELRAGSLPLWNPHQFAGAPFWGNGQSAPLFPLHLLFAALPLQLGLVLLPWLRFLVAGLGAWALARQLGTGERGALVSALVLPLSGMLVSFLLFPMGNALALVPWVFFAVERLAAGVGGWPALAALGGLQLLAGHPETAVHTAALSALYLVVRGASGGRLRGLGGLLVGWLIAGAVAAVQLLPLAHVLLESSRWLGHGEGPLPAPALALAQMLRAVLPQLYGNPAQGTWWGPFNYSATAVYAGALTLPLAAAALPVARRDPRFRAVAVVLAVSLLVAYHLPGLIDLLRVLPVVGKMAHHRLLFAVELSLALLAGRGLDAWQAGDGRALLAGAALIVGLSAAAWGLFHDDWASHALTADALRWTAWALAVALLAALGLAVPPARRSRLWAVAPLLLVADLWAAHHAINPGLSLARLYPETGAVAFLAGRPGRLVGTGSVLRPNAAMVYGLDDLRGDDPVKLQRFEVAYRQLAAGSAVYFRPVRRWDGARLDRWGVRWVVSRAGAPPREPGWRPVYRGTDAWVWERPSAFPLARWTRPDGSPPPPRPATVLEHRPGRWKVDLADRPEGATLLVVAETWDSGWRGEVDGRSVAVVERDEDGVPLLAISAPAGGRRLALRYVAPGLVPGALLTLLGIGGVVAGGWWRRRRPISVAPSDRGATLR